MSYSDVKEKVKNKARYWTAEKASKALSSCSEYLSNCISLLGDFDNQYCCSDCPEEERSIKARESLSGVIAEIKTHQNKLSRIVKSFDGNISASKE